MTLERKLTVFVDISAHGGVPTGTRATSESTSESLEYSRNKREIYLYYSHIMSHNMRNKSICTHFLKRSPCATTNYQVCKTNILKSYLAREFGCEAEFLKENEGDNIPDCSSNDLYKVRGWL